MHHLNSDYIVFRCIHYCGIPMWRIDFAHQNTHTHVRTLVIAVSWHEVLIGKPYVAVLLPTNYGTPVVSACIRSNKQEAIKYKGKKCKLDQMYKIAVLCRKRAVLIVTANYVR